MIHWHRHSIVHVNQNFKLLLQKIGFLGVMILLPQKGRKSFTSISWTPTEFIYYNNACHRIALIEFNVYNGNNKILANINCHRNIGISLQKRGHDFWGGKKGLLLWLSSRKPRIARPPPKILWIKNEAEVTSGQV